MRDKIFVKGVTYRSFFFNTMVIEWMAAFVTVTILWPLCLSLFTLGFHVRVYRLGYGTVFCLCVSGKKK